MTDIPEIFRYTKVEVPEDCIHKISPSQIDKFFSYPKNYYLENIAGGEYSFQGSTATVLGTICHYIYECVTKGIAVNREDINIQLNEYNTLKPELNLDVDEIKTMYPLITSAVVNEYLLPANSSNRFIKTEESVLMHIKDGIYLAGTTDRIEGSTIVDFKTVGVKPNDNIISWQYKIQLLAYAWAFRKKNYIIDSIRIVYGIKPTKKIDARCLVVNHLITYEDEVMIENTLKLMADTVVMCNRCPELVYLLFKSMDLK